MAAGYCVKSSEAERDECWTMGECGPHSRWVFHVQQNLLESSSQTCPETCLLNSSKSWQSELSDVVCVCVCNLRLAGHRCYEEGTSWEKGWRREGKTEGRRNDTKCIWKSWREPISFIRYVISYKRMLPGAIDYYLTKTPVPGGGYFHLCCWSEGSMIIPPPQI